MADASEADDIINSDNSFDPTENTQDTSHSPILDSAQLNEQVISQLVQETVQHSQEVKLVLPPARGSLTDDNDQTLEENWNYYQESLIIIFFSFKNSIPNHTKNLELCHKLWISG